MNHKISNNAVKVILLTLFFLGLTMGFPATGFVSCFGFASGSGAEDSMSPASTLPTTS